MFESFMPKVRSNPQIIAIALISLASFLLFYVFFQQTSSVEYFKEIVAALIATLLTVTITTLLLRAQTTGEEIKERNVEVFKRKVEIYDKFLTLLIDTLADNEIDELEARQIRKQIYLLSLFSSPETVEIVVRFVRQHMLHDTDEEQTLHELVQAFREELKLDTSDGGITSELEGIESLLAVGFEHRHQFTLIKKFFSEFSDKIIQKAPEGWSASEPSAIMGGLNFDLSTESGSTYIFQLNYPTDPEFAELLLMAFVDLSEEKAARRGLIEKAALEQGFSWEGEESKDRFTESLMSMEFMLKCRRGEEGDVTVLGAPALRKIQQAVSAIEAKVRAGAIR